MLGCVAILVPWFIMDAGTPLSSPEHPKIHTIIGFVLTVYSLGQLLLGKLRPGATKPGEEPTRKRRLWEMVHKYSGRAAILVALWQLASGSWLSSEFLGSDWGGESYVWLACLAGVLLLVVGRTLQLSRACSTVSPSQRRSTSSPKGTGLDNHTMQNAGP